MKSRPMVFAFAAFVAFTGCDAMKQMIDPTGNMYKKPGDTAKPAAQATTNSSSQTAAKPASTSSSSTASAPAAAPPAPAGRVTEAPIRIKAEGRFLTPRVLEGQISEITFQAQGRSFQFQKGIYRDKKGITSAHDLAGKFWGLAIGDVNMDGSDDAALILRTDRPGGAVAWDLAYLPNRSGRLFNVQTLTLPGDQGYRDIVIEGSGILLVPNIEGPSVHLGYAGGELNFVGR